MKRVSMMGLAAAVGLALLAGRPAFADDQAPKTDRNAAIKAAVEKIAAEQAAKKQDAKAKQDTDKAKADQSADKSKTDKSAVNKSKQNGKTHTANKPVSHEADMKSSEKSGAKMQASKGRLPSGWGKLDLSDAQRQQVYAAESKYSGQIKKLEAQIQMLKDSRHAEMVAVLTPQQKSALETATKEAASKKATAHAAKTTTTASNDTAVKSGEDESASANGDKSTQEKPKKRNRRKRDDS